MPTSGDPRGPSERMSAAPTLLLPLGLQPSRLYRSKCVDVLMDEKASKVTITAHGGDGVDASCAISGIMQSAEALLRRGKAYSVVWDLRDSPTPNLRETMRLAAWGLSKKTELEHLTTKMGVIVSDGPAASVAGGLLATFSGVPVVISASAEEVHRYA